MNTKVSTPDKINAVCIISLNAYFLRFAQIINFQFSIFNCLILIALILAISPISAQKKAQTNVSYTEINDVFVPASYGNVRINGYLGDKLDLCIDNRVMAQDIDRVVKPFYLRNDGGGGFRCEFWGKWFTSAMLGYGYAPTENHKKVIDRAVDELLKAQTSEGYIGTYPDGQHLGDWDIWGRKYVLLGLIAYYDQTKNTKALDAARKLADHLIKEAGAESEVNIAATGWIGWKGLAPSSVLEPIALLYQKTGDRRYSEFAEHIIKSWDTPNVLSPIGIRLIQEAISETPLWEMSGAPKAYEMMSCFEGLCEMYRVTGKKVYFDACQSLINSIIRDEIMIVGSASTAEIWCNGKMRQSDPMYQGMETCVTATWMKFLFQMLRLTGDSKYVDLLEVGLYNALLAAQTPKGEWWSYFTSLMGERVPSFLQYNDVVMSCCVANGPRGLLLTPSWAAMMYNDGVVVNLYGKIHSQLKTPRGQEIVLGMDSDYPVKETVNAIVTISQKETFGIKLRIPEWSKNTRIKINGQSYAGYVIPGSYAEIKREWSDNDRIEIVFDLRARVENAPSGVNDAAIMRGPIVLAFDSRLVAPRTGVSTPPMYRYKFMKGPGTKYIDVELIENSENPDIWMMFNIPLTDEAGAKHYLPMCDYLSAGNTWKEGNVFRVWVPQPFDFRHLYINKLDWRVNFVGNDVRPEIPALYAK